MRKEEGSEHQAKYGNDRAAVKRPSIETKERGIPATKCKLLSLWLITLLRPVMLLEYNSQYCISQDNDLTQNPPRSVDFILTSDTIVQIINHKYNLRDKTTF